MAPFFLVEKNNRNKWTNKFRELGKNKGSRSDFINLYKEMKKEKENNSPDDNYNEPRPSKMRGVAFPKAKYGVIAAIIIIVMVNLIYYKDFLLSLI